MALSFVSPGTYVLGGISAPTRGTGQAFRAGLTTAQQRRERELAMNLRASAEARAQEQFEMAKADRARAAAAAARIQAAQEEALKNRPAGLTIPTAPITSAPPPASMRLEPPSAVSPSLPTVDTAPPGQTPAAGLTIPGAGDTTLAGGPGADTLVAPTTPYSGRPMVPGQMPAAPLPTTPYSGRPTVPGQMPADPLTVLAQELSATFGDTAPRSLATPDLSQYGPAPLGVDQITEIDPTASAAVQDIQALRRRLDIADAAMRIGNSALEPTLGFADYVLRTPEEGAQRAEAEEQGRRVQRWYMSDAAQQLFQTDPELLIAAARDPRGFYEQYVDEEVAVPAQLTEPMTEAPAQPTAPMTEAPAQPTAPMTEAPAQPTAPMTEAPAQPTAPAAPAGLAMTPPAAQELDIVAAQTDGDISQFYLRNPASTLQMADNAYRDIQRWEGLVNYYRQIGDLSGVVEAEIGLSQARQAFSDMSGQLALAGVQLDNYGPLQVHLQQLYPSGTVEVRPYTDGTVEIFVDGDSIRRDPKEKLLEVLASAFNDEYRNGQAQLAAAAAAARSSAYERQLEVAGAIAIENVEQQGRIDLKLLEAEIARLEGASSVSLKRVDDPTGQQRPIFEYKAPGEPTRYIVFREVPGVGDTPMLEYDFIPLPSSQ